MAWFTGVFLTVLLVTCVRAVIFISCSVTETYRNTSGATGTSCSMCGGHNTQVRTVSVLLPDRRSSTLSSMARRLCQK